MESNELFKKSLDKVPGGVHSPVRSFKGLHCSPVFMKKGKGAYLKDIDGNKYIDFCMSFGPLILGHKDEEVLEQLHKTLEKGWSFGTCEKYSYELAEFLIDRIPFIEQIRFVNSGTEAVMTALRLARGITGRNKIIKFSGCYHGHTDSMLIKAGSGVAQMSEASSKGVPRSITEDTLVLDLGDEESLEKCFETYHDQIAAVIIEPLPANNGLLIQRKEFLQKLKDLTKKYHSLLIFDEVISGLRVQFGGMSAELGITPDIVTYGKIIGGGLPVGAIAGNKEIMSYLAPLGEVYQAGTLSANPLAMTAGLHTLKKLTPETYQKIENDSETIARTFQNFFKNSQILEFKNINVISYKSLFWFSPEKSHVENISQISKNLNEHFQVIFKKFLEQGIYLSPNAYEIGFISLAHNNKVIEKLKDKLSHIK